MKTAFVATLAAVGLMASPALAAPTAKPTKAAAAKTTTTHKVAAKTVKAPKKR